MGRMLPSVKKEACEGGSAAASSAATSGGSSAKTAGSTWLMVRRPTATLHMILHIKRLGFIAMAIPSCADMAFMVYRCQ